MHRRGGKQKKLSSKNMSEPIDFIDLTVDSPNKIRIDVQVDLLPASSRNRNRNRNIENIPRNGTTTTTKSQRKNVTKQSAQRNDSVIEIPNENAPRNVHSTEIIEVDAISTPANNKANRVSDSAERNALPLTCPICFEQLSSEMKPMSTRCGHIFCSHCLELATHMSKKCPTCKKAVKFHNCTRLYF